MTAILTDQPWSGHKETPAEEKARIKHKVPPNGILALSLKQKFEFC